MKFAYKDDEDVPPDAKKIPFVVEPTDGGFWTYDEGCRSAGRLPTTPFSAILRWIVRQIVYGHCVEHVDEAGDVIALTIGQLAPSDLPSVEAAAEAAGKALLGLNIVRVLAEGREKGTSAKTCDAESSMWQKATPSAHRRLEFHYALLFCELLGRTSKKLKTLEMLPILESAPQSTRDYLAEATRCYLLKLDRACVALCRACLEETLKSVLTEVMQQQLRDEISLRKKGEMQALIDVCARAGLLGSHKKAAHDIREAGNQVLHLKQTAPDSGMAASVLKKTRTVIGFLHGRRHDHG